jgi:RNase P subunit RPR2
MKRSRYFAKKSLRKTPRKHRVSYKFGKKIHHSIKRRSCKHCMKGG